MGVFQQMLAKTHVAILRPLELGAHPPCSDAVAQSSGTLLEEPSIFGAFAMLPAVLKSASPCASAKEIAAVIRKVIRKPGLLETIEAFEGGISMILDPHIPQGEMLIVTAITFRTIFFERLRLQVTALPLANDMRRPFYIAAADDRSRALGSMDPSLSTYPILLRVASMGNSETSRWFQERNTVVGENAQFPVSVFGYFENASEPPDQRS